MRVAHNVRYAISWGVDVTCSIQIALGYEFDVKASMDEVFSVLSNVPESASYYPKVEQLTQLEPDVYQWEMERIGAGQIYFQSVYACHYKASKGKGSIVWTPIDDVGNTLVSGSWQISKHKSHTNVVLKVSGEVTLPLPAIMHALVSPALQQEFETLTETYIDNLIKRFGGEV